MSFDPYHRGSHVTYLTQYHIIWCPKFRFSVLPLQRRVCLESILRDICNNKGYIVKALEIMPDHIHLFVDIPYTVSPAEAVRTLKSISARKLLEEFPDLREFYSRRKVLWSRGAFISSIGIVSEETVKNYINSQWEHRH